MRIAVKFSPSVDYSGGSQHTFARHLIPALHACHSDLVLFTANPRFFGEMNGLKILPAGNPFLQPGLPRKMLSYVYQQATLGAAIRRAGCDVLLCPYTYEVMWLDRRVPQVSLVHDLIPLIYPQDFKVTAALWRWVYLPALKRARAVIVISENTKQDLLRFCAVPPQRVFIAPVGFAPPLPGGGGPPAGGLSPYILYVSSSQYPYKNLLRLFQAYGAICREFPHRLVVVGKRVPRFGAQIDRQLAELDLGDRIQLRENLSDAEISSLYRHADVFVYPSTYEGFGIPPLEAMAYGIPVVAARAASIPEVCGDAAYYIDPYSVDSLADGLRRLLTDQELRAQLRRAGLERIRAFSWPAMAERIVQICDWAVRPEGH